MKKFVLGTVTGLILTAALPALAIPNWVVRPMEPPIVVIPVPPPVR